MKNVITRMTKMKPCKLKKSEIHKQIPVFSLLQSIFSVSEVLSELCKAFQGTAEAIGERPAFSVAVSFVEPRYVVNDAHAAHLAADSLEPA
jgi:hypothetical protein